MKTLAMPPLTRFTKRSSNPWASQPIRGRCKNHNALKRCAPLGAGLSRIEDCLAPS